MKPIGLHADHFHHLTAACDQFRQALAVGISERTWFWPNAFGEQGNSLSVECVGLGEPPDGTGKIPDLTRIDDGHRQIALAKAAATVTSNPPVASSTISAGASLRSSLTRSSRPSSLRWTARV